MEYFQQYTSVSDMFIALPMACFLYLPTSMSIRNDGNIYCLLERESLLLVI